MSTTSKRSAGTQITERGVVKGQVILDPKTGLPVDVIVDSAGKHRLAVDANVKIDTVDLEVNLDVNDDGVHIGDVNTGYTLTVESDGSINVNVKVDATDGDNIAISNAAGTHKAEVDANLDLHVFDTIVKAAIDTTNGLLTTIRDNADQVETLITSTNTKLDTVNTNLTDIKTEIDSANYTTNESLSKATAIAGQLDDASTVVATEDNVASVRITPQRAIHTNLRNNAGTEIGTSGAPVRTDPTGTTTQPISATTLPLPTGASTETTLAKLPLTQGSTTAGQSGILEQGAVTTAAPAYTNGQTSPLSLTPAGALRVDNSAVTQTSKITDGADLALVTTNGEQKVNDGLRNGGVYGNLSLPTANTPVEAKVGASRLTNRKFLTITALNDMYWGYDSSVTSSNGTPLSKNQFISFQIDTDSTFQIWLVATTNSKDARITESA